MATSASTAATAHANVAAACNALAAHQGVPVVLKLLSPRPWFRECAVEEVKEHQLALDPDCLTVQEHPNQCYEWGAYVYNFPTRLLLSTHEFQVYKIQKLERRVRSLQAQLKRIHDVLLVADVL